MLWRIVLVSGWLWCPLVSAAVKGNLVSPTIFRPDLWLLQKRSLSQSFFSVRPGVFCLVFSAGAVFTSKKCCLLRPKKLRPAWLSGRGSLHHTVTANHAGFGLNAFFGWTPVDSFDPKGCNAADCVLRKCLGSNFGLVENLNLNWFWLPGRVYLTLAVFHLRKRIREFQTRLSGSTLLALGHTTAGDLHKTPTPHPTPCLPPAPL